MTFALFPNFRLPPYWLTQLFTALAVLAFYPLLVGFALAIQARHPHVQALDLDLALSISVFTWGVAVMGFGGMTRRPNPSPRWQAAHRVLAFFMALVSGALVALLPLIFFGTLLSGLPGMLLALVWLALAALITRFMMPHYRQLLAS